MKVTGLLLLVTVFCISTSCRKDKAVHLPEPNGNLLIMEVDESFNLIGGNELKVQSLKVSSELLEIEVITSNNRWNILSIGSHDTIFDISNGKLTKPKTLQIFNLQKCDDRLYNSISASDITSLFSLEIDTDNILLQIGNITRIDSFIFIERKSFKNYVSEINFLQI